MATELEIARRAVERGLLSDEQLDACLVERRKLLQDGLEMSLRDLLFDKGLLDAARWGELVAPPRALAETRDEPREAREPSDAGPEQEILGDYRVLRELGRGAMGVVYEAVQERLGRRVALKVLPATQALQGTARERFLREAKAMASLRHPGIVQVFDIEEERGVHFFAMELLSGRSLRRALEEDGALEPREAARIGRSVAQALAYAHEEGVIHRDVKPDNIIIRADGSAALTDFGLALREQAEYTLTQAGTIVGTPLYMAPEQASGSKELDGRVDVYGLSVTLYELLSGKAPFREAKDTAVLLEWIAERDPTPLRQRAPEVPAALAAIVEVGLAKDPAQRFAGAAELAADLDRFLKGEPILARPPSPLGRVWRLARRRARALAALAALAAVLLGGGLFAQALSRRWQAEGLVLEALQFVDRGQLEAAEASLDRALALTPGLAEAHAQRGELLVLRGELAEGRAAFDRALSHDARHLGALLARAELLEDQGEREAALRDMRAAQELAGPDDARSRLALGTLLAASDPEEAREHLRQGLELARARRDTRSPRYLKAVLALGRLELEQGTPDAAVVELEEAVRLLPEEPEPQVLLGRALEARGDPTAALEAFAAALRRDGENAEALEGRGRCYRLQGALSEAYADLSAVADVRPTARQALGLLLFEAVGFRPSVRFDDDAARAQLEPAAADEALAPRLRAEAWIALGWLELHSARPSRTEALEAFTRALELDPSAAGARLARGLVLLDWNRLEEAEQELAAARGAKPTRYAALVGLARVARGRGERARALELLDEAIELAPERVAAYATRYLLRLEAGERVDDDRSRALSMTPLEGYEAFRASSDPLRLAEHATVQGNQALAGALRTESSSPWERQIAIATAWLERARVYDPRSPAAAARLGSVLYLNGRFPAAVDAFHQARRLDPLLVDVEILRAVTLRDVLVEAGGPKAARRILLEARERRDLPPRMASVLEVELAKCSLALGDADQALEHLARAQEGGPPRWVVASLRARILAERSDPHTEAALRESARLFYEGQRDPERSSIYARAGEELEGRDRDRGALHLLTRAIEYDPLNALAWRRRSAVYLRSSAETMPFGFVDAFVSSEIDPRRNTERFLELEARLSRYMRLLPILDDRIDRMLTAKPDLPAASFCKGFLSFYQGRLDVAVAAFTRAHELSGGRSYLSLCYRGVAQMRQGKLEEAERDLDAAEEIYRGGPVVRFWLACLRVEQGREREALDLLERAARARQLQPGHLRETLELKKLRDHPRVRELLTELEAE